MIDYLFKTYLSVQLGLLILTLIGINESLYAEASKAKSQTKSTEVTKAKSNVLDFEADVIEGERVAPSLFVQMDLGAPKLDTLMFQRKNFNDFHSIDMRRKPKYRIKGK
jgi:hypothetical protein